MSTAFSTDDAGRVDLSTDGPEGVVCAMILRKPVRLTIARTVVQAAHFINPTFRLIYERIDQLVGRGVVPAEIPLGTLLTSFTGHRLQSEVQRVLPELQAIDYADDLFPIYLDMMTRLFLRREIHKAGQKMQLLALSDTLQEADILVKAHQYLGNLNTGGDKKQILTPAKRAQMAVESIGARQAGDQVDISSGYKRLDALLGGGFAKGSMSVITATTGGFKTTFALSMARRMAWAGRKVLYMTPEMTEDQMGLKDMASFVGVPVDRLRAIDGLSEDEWLAVMAAANVFSHRNYYSWPHNGTIDEFRSVMSYMKETIGLDVVFIDYLQLVKERNDKISRYDHVTQVSAALRDMAKELDIVVIALAQMSRVIYGSASMVPSKEMLKESGNLENDAWAILGLYWPWGISRVPGKFVPEVNTPLRREEWLALGAKHIPVDETPSMLPVSTELQIVGLKTRMAQDSGLVRVGLNAVHHDIFDPMTPPDMYTQLTQTELEALPEIQRMATVYDEDMSVYFSKQRPNVESLAASYMDMAEVTRQQPGDGTSSLIAQVIAAVRSPAIIEAVTSMEDLI